MTLATDATARSDDTEQPVKIEADSAELNDRTGVSIYRGDVQVTQGTMVLNAQRVKIVAPQRTIEKAIADGDKATFRQTTDDGKKLYAEARHMEYVPADNTIVLTGDAHLEQGANTFASERIEYNTLRSVVDAGNPSGKGRVEMTLVPQGNDEDEPSR